MPEAKVIFDDAVAYERFMGRWSRAIGKLFLDWLAPPANARWLDVGCGTGAFTQLVLDTCAPSSIVGIDPSTAQIEHARKQPSAQRAEFRIGDSMDLPFPDATFDIVVSALVIHFIPDRPRALREMHRVGRPGAIVTGYVWDRTLTSEAAPTAPMLHAIREMGIDVPQIPGAADASPDRFRTLFDGAGFVDVAAASFETAQSYRDFDDYWQSQTPAFSPAGKIVASMQEADRAKLREGLRAALPTGPDGTIAYSARANAIKARVP